MDSSRVYMMIVTDCVLWPQSLYHSKIRVGIF